MADSASPEKNVPSASALIAVYDPEHADVVVFSGHDEGSLCQVEASEMDKKSLVSFANNVAGARRGPVLVSIFLSGAESNLEAQSFPLTGSITHQSPLEVHRSVLFGSLKGANERVSGTELDSLKQVLSKFAR